MDLGREHVEADLDLLDVLIAVERDDVLVAEGDRAIAVAAVLELRPALTGDHVLLLRHEPIERVLDRQHRRHVREPEMVPLVLVLEANVGNRAPARILGHACDLAGDPDDVDDPRADRQVVVGDFLLPLIVDEPVILHPHEREVGVGQDLGRRLVVAVERGERQPGRVHGDDARVLGVGRLRAAAGRDEDRVELLVLGMRPGREHGRRVDPAEHAEGPPPHVGDGLEPRVAVDVLAKDRLVGVPREVGAADVTVEHLLPDRRHLARDELRAAVGGLPDLILDRVRRRHRGRQELLPPTQRRELAHLERGPQLHDGSGQVIGRPEVVLRLLLEVVGPLVMLADPRLKVRTERAEIGAVAREDLLVVPGEPDTERLDARGERLGPHIHRHRVSSRRR